MHPHPALRATFSQREKNNSSRQSCTQMFQNLQKIVLDSDHKGHYNFPQIGLTTLKGVNGGESRTSSGL